MAHPDPGHGEQIDMALEAVKEVSVIFIAYGLEREYQRQSGRRLACVKAIFGHQRLLVESSALVSMPAKALYNLSATAG